MTERIPKAEIFTDGARKGSPGGWGALLRCGTVEKECCGGEGSTTNTRMELQATIEGLNALTRASNVTFTIDSQYVRRGITEWLAKWKQKGGCRVNKKAVKNVDLWQVLDNAVQQREVSWHWVKSHSGRRENEIADQLANHGIEMLKQG